MPSPERKYNFSQEEDLYHTFSAFSKIQEEDISFVLPPGTTLWPLIPTKEMSVIEQFGDQELYARIPVKDAAENDPVRRPVLYIKIDNDTFVAANYIMARAEFEEEESPFRVACRDILNILEQGKEYEEVLKQINLINID